ncbi:regulator [Nakamurella flava]|uniref:Regulator n=1 Tax=Nakamurella flava TaxID=2576308 RepID=A0A4U6QFA5_9ACTN|nr:DUF5685 family protein [Nakamurella flava]TKV58947.1 regulator [Nakamurella flava]
MFGLLHTCGHVLDGELLERWRAHLCGLCLTLRDRQGQPARALTNTDAVALAVLVNAQSRAAVATRTAGPCPLRGMRPAPVVCSSNDGMRLAATASVTLAAAKAQDRRVERENDLGATGVVQRGVDRATARMAPSLIRRAQRDTEMAERIDLHRTVRQLADQGRGERAVRVGDPVLSVTGPSAAAAGRIFAASAGLAGRPENESSLRAAGEAFGALAHLLDAVEDLDRDRRTGAFNPILATGTPIPLVRRDCARQVRRLRHHLGRLDLDRTSPDARLALRLLGDGTHQAVHRTFDRAAAGPGSPDRTSGAGWPTDLPPPVPKPPSRPPFWPRLLPWIGVYCTGYACCAEHENPCTGQRHPPACSGGDGCGDCGDCCDCCDCGCDC